MAKNGVFFSGGDHNIEKNIKEDAEILAIPPSEKTAVFKEDEAGNYPRLEQSLHVASCRLYFFKIKKLVNPPSIQEGFNHATIEDFFSIGKNSMVIMSSLNLEEKLDKLNTFLEESSISNFTYAIIRDKNTGEIGLSVGGSGAHAVSTMDARIGNFLINKKVKDPDRWKMFSVEEIECFQKTRQDRFEVLAAGDIDYNSWSKGVKISINNRSGAYPDAYIDPNLPDAERGVENTRNALKLFGLDTYFKPCEFKEELNSLPKINLT